MGRRVTCLLGDWTDRYPLRRAGIFLIVLKNNILATSECGYGGSELTDVKALVDALTLEEKATLTAGEDMLSTVAVERMGIPKVHVTDGPNGARGKCTSRHGWCALDLHPVRLRTRGNLESRARPGARRPRREGGARPWLSRTARAHGEPASLTARRTQLRVLLRGPAIVGTSRRRVCARCPVRGRLRHRQAFRRQRGRVRAGFHQLCHRRTRTPRALPAPLRDRRPRGWRARHHDGVQPAERALAHPARRVLARHSA